MGPGGQDSVKCVLLAATEFIIPLCRTHFALSLRINIRFRIYEWVLYIRRSIQRSVLSDFKWDKHRTIQLQVGALVKGNPSLLY